MRQYRVEMAQVQTPRDILRKVLAILALAVFYVAGAAKADAGAERRLALVIGIAEYETLPDLNNTINDSRLLKKTLEEIGFEVRALTNPGLEALRREIDTFAFAAETADVALVYFAGHGVEAGGRNFLIPADSPARNRKEVVRTAVTLEEVLAAVDHARQLRIVILDSCRNDPFEEIGDGAVASSVTGGAVQERAGLVPPAPERGTLVAYAARHGQSAIDGLGANSPFALALAETLGTPDLEIGLMFRRVRDAVMRQTMNRQEPYTYGSLPGRPYFLAGGNQVANRLTEAARLTAWTRLDVDQAVQLAALAKEGDARAMLGLAYMRMDPNAPGYAPQEAAELLERAAALGDAEAQYELGRLYETGIGVERDVGRALSLYRQSAEAGFADALNDLGFLYFQGAEGVRRDTGVAVAYFQRAAELRQPEAMFNTAALIDDGVIEGKGPEAAARLLYDALRSGNREVLDVLSDNPRMFKPQTRAALQRTLAERGFYDGVIDGQFGPLTQRGLRRAYGLAQ